MHNKTNFKLIKNLRKFTLIITLRLYTNTNYTRTKQGRSQKLLIEGGGGQGRTIGANVKHKICICNINCLR